MKNQLATTERFAWLSCYGVPLNAWDYNTFKSVGKKWGAFFSVDDSTLKLLSFSKAKVLIATNVDKKIDATVNLNVAGIIYVVKVIEEESCQVPLSVEFSQPEMTAIPVHLKTSEKDAEKDDHEKDDESEEEGDDSDNLDVVADTCEVNNVNNEVHKEVILKEVTALIINNNCLLEIENDNKHATDSSLVRG